VASIALYYPWMHFQDDSWLKLALLTWDNIVRVRPRELDDRDRELVRTLRAETDFIVEVEPSATDLALVSDTLTEIIDSNRELIVRLYGGMNDTRWPAADVIDPYTAPQGQGPVMPASNIYVAPSAPSLLWVYCGDSGSKVGVGLRDLLLRANLATEEPSGLPWLGLHPKLGSIYLIALADAMARNNNLSPATDDQRMHHAVGALDRLTDLLLDDLPRVPAVADPENAYLNVALHAVIEPERLASVPVAKLIMFRQRHQPELAAFREHVASLATQLQQIAAVENLSVAQAHLESLYFAATKPKLDELRRALRGLGIDSTAGSLAMKIDLSAGAGTLAGAIAATGGQLAVAGTAIAVTAVPYLIGKLKTRHQHLTQSPVAYLLAADRKLAGSSLLRTLR
jgi:hypothetical protein